MHKFITVQGRQLQVQENARGISRALQSCSEQPHLLRRAPRKWGPLGGILRGHPEFSSTLLPQYTLFSLVLSWEGIENHFRVLINDHQQISWTRTELRTPAASTSLARPRQELAGEHVSSPPGLHFRQRPDAVEGFHGLALLYRGKRTDLGHQHYVCKTNMAICHKVCVVMIYPDLQFLG